MTSQLDRFRSRLVVALIAVAMIAGGRTADVHAWAGAQYSGWYGFGMAPPQGLSCATDTWSNGGIVVVCPVAPFTAGWYWAPGGVFFNYQSSPPNWSGWNALGTPPSGMFGAPAIGRDSLGQLHVFIRGGDLYLWERYQRVDGSWTAWNTFGGGVLSGDPVTMRDLADYLHVLGRGMDGALWERQEDNGHGAWQDWRSIGGWMTYDRPVVMGSLYGMVVVVVGGDYGIYANFNYIGGSWGWSGWQALGGTATTGIGGAQSGACTPNTDDPRYCDYPAYVFWRDVDGELYENWEAHKPGGWNGRIPMGGVFPNPSPSPPVVARNGDGRLEVFMIGMDGALWHRYQLDAVGAGYWSWSNWESLGGYLISPPAIGRNIDGRLEIFQEGRDALYHNWQLW